MSGTLATDYASWKSLQGLSNDEHAKIVFQKTLSPRIQSELRNSQENTLLPVVRMLPSLSNFPKTLSLKPFSNTYRLKLPEEINSRLATSRDGGIPIWDKFWEGSGTRSSAFANGLYNVFWYKC